MTLSPDTIAKYHRKIARLEAANDDLQQQLRAYEAGTIILPARQSGKNNAICKQIWECYVSGQFGERSLKWHVRNTPGFKDYAAEQRSNPTDTQS